MIIWWLTHYCVSIITMDFVIQSQRKPFEVLILGFMFFFSISVISAFYDSWFLILLMFKKMSKCDTIMQALFYTFFFLFANEWAKGVCLSQDHEWVREWARAAWVVLGEWNICQVITAFPYSKNKVLHET